MCFNLYLTYIQIQKCPQSLYFKALRAPIMLNIIYLPFTTLFIRPLQLHNPNIHHVLVLQLLYISLQQEFLQRNSSDSLYNVRVW